MKKFAIILIAVIMLMLSGCSNNNYKEVDLSDIEDMVVYTEGPHLLYADEDRAIIYFNGFGVIVFDIKEETVTDRISAEELIELLKGEYPNIKASPDGEVIYIGTDDMMDQDPHYVYEYSIEKGKRSKTNKRVEETETFETKSNEDFKQYFINPCQFSVVVEIDGAFVYLYEEGGQIKTLQLVICPYDADKNTVIDIF